MTTAMTQDEIDALNEHPLRPFRFEQVTNMIRGTDVVEPQDWNREEVSNRFFPPLLDINDTVEIGTYNGLRDLSEPDAHPKKIVYDKSYSGQGADFNNRLVSERLMTLIEEYEPGVHQFIPYEVLSRKDRKTRIDIRYYLHIRAFRSPVDLSRAKLRKRWYSDGTSIDRLNMRLAEMGSDNRIKLDEQDFRFLTYDWAPEDEANVPLSLDHLEGHHLWLDRFTARQYISSELRERMTKEKITGLTYKRWNSDYPPFPKTGTLRFHLSAPLKKEGNDD